MENINIKAKEYADKAWSEIEEFNEDHVIFENIVTNSFVAGAMTEKFELLRWRNPKVELPDYYRAVLIKYLKDGLYKYAIAWLAVSDNGEYLWTIDETDIIINDRNVHFWRPIL